MTNNRGMSVFEARALAKDPKTSPGVLSRLANGYPEVWDELLANPSVDRELRKWIEQAKTEQTRMIESMNIDTQSKPFASASMNQTQVVRKVKTRGRRKFGRFAKTIGVLLAPAVMVSALWLGVDYLDRTQPELGIVAMETLNQPQNSPSWQYSLESVGGSSCTLYEFATLDQNQAVVLMQNDLDTEDCKDLKNPIPSTLALVDLVTGKEFWKIDLAGELDWTEKWQKQLVEIPGLNEVLVKFTDINGSDADGEKKSIDDSQNRKMKTLVPYNRLNGLITDPVIAKSKYQPIIQAPVLEVLPIPGELRRILVMTNGSKKDFRYAMYRSKRLSSARWSVESNLKPIGGNPIVGSRLILGRGKSDLPKSVKLGSGSIGIWSGKPAVKLYRIGNATVQISGDGLKEKATNLLSQGGLTGKKITIDGIDDLGNTLWTLESDGYAISQDDSLTTMTNRRYYSRLFVLSGKDNRNVSLVDVENGELLWTTKISKTQFEISRVNSASTVSLYLSKKFSTESKSASVLNLLSGQESEPIKIAGRSVRVDGQTAPISVLVDEPTRGKIIKNVEAGTRVNLDNSEDKSDETRVCARGISNDTYKSVWTFKCNGNQHLTRVGGRWILVDLSEGLEQFWPLGQG
jgi:hypothetical protein